MHWIWFSIYCAMQALAQVFFKWGARLRGAGFSASSWERLRSFQHLALMLLYRVWNANVALAVGSAGGFLCAQAALAMVFRLHVTPLHAGRRCSSPRHGPVVLAAKLREELLMTRSSAPLMQDLNSGWTLPRRLRGGPEAPWIPAAVPGTSIWTSWPPVAFPIPSSVTSGRGLFIEIGTGGARHCHAVP